VAWPTTDTPRVDDSGFRLVHFSLSLPAPSPLVAVIFLRHLTTVARVALSSVVTRTRVGSVYAPGQLVIVIVVVWRRQLPQGGDRGRAGVPTDGSSCRIATMSFLPGGQIFRELQVVHDTGYFASTTSLEDRWQEVRDVSVSICIAICKNTEEMIAHT